jgi:hypothetical protein
VTLPDTTKAIQINGTVAGGAFGVVPLGIGQFFSSAAGATLVATASVAGTAYAFGGQSPPGGVLTAASADDSTVGVGADRYGSTAGFLGPLGTSPGALTIGATSGKYVDLDLGTATTGPFLGATGTPPAPSIHFVDLSSGNSFGVINIGSGISGTSQAVSFIGGDNLPDLVLAGQGETNKPIYLVSGAVLTTLSGTVNVAAPQTGNVPGIVQVSSKFPADWSSGFTTGCAILDLNGDLHADFAIGESVSGKPGRVAVFY